jgi:hypothetical protein
MGIVAGVMMGIVAIVMMVDLVKTMMLKEILQPPWTRRSRNAIRGLLGRHTAEVFELL